MDATGFIAQWVGKEIVAFSGNVKYRGILSDVLEGGFAVLQKVAIVSTGQDTSEYESCIINLTQVSGIASEELSGRGVTEIPGAYE